METVMQPLTGNCPTVEHDHWSSWELIEDQKGSSENPSEDPDEF
jgi:hypothetical protein